MCSNIGKYITLLRWITYRYSKSSKYQSSCLFMGSSIQECSIEISYEYRKVVRDHLQMLLPFLQILSKSSSNPLQLIPLILFNEFTLQCCDDYLPVCLILSCLVIHLMIVIVVFHSLLIIICTPYSVHYHYHYSETLLICNS